MREEAEGRNASLAIFQVGDVEASNRYVRNKIKDCEEVGIIANLHKLPEYITQEELQAEVDKCNDSGIIVQLPLPKHLDAKMIKIPLEKDVDGFMLGTKFTPCTPGGIIKYLEYCDFKFDGANAVVLGRSDIVGRPMAKLLLDKNCSVTVLHSKSKDGFKRTTLQEADLVVCAVGKPGIIRSSQAANAVIIDVGINFVDGKLVGDVEHTAACDSRVTPVPGGVGLLTRCMLLDNTIKACIDEQ